MKFYGRGMGPALAHCSRVQCDDETYGLGMRPCPACPDGQTWTRDGPTGATCQICGGYGVVNMDGSPLRSRGS